MRRLGEGMGARNLAESVPITTLSIVVLAVTASVIAMGGMIRIYDAGESCPDWPTCFGTWGFDVSEDEQESWWDENPEEEDSRGAAPVSYTHLTLPTILLV